MLSLMLLPNLVSHSLWLYFFRLFCFFLLCGHGSGLTLNEEFHELFDAGLWYIEPGSHRVCAMQALGSLHSIAAAAQLLKLDQQQQFVIQFSDPAASPPDALLAVQQEFCDEQKELRKADYEARRLLCDKCGARYKLQDKLDRHLKRCDSHHISRASVFTPAHPSSSVAAAASPSFPTPSDGNNFDFKQVGLF